MSKNWCSAMPHGVRLTVQVAPNAKKSEVMGVLDDAIKIRLQAPPIEGRANEALVRYLADILAVPKSAITVVHGHTSKRKIVDISHQGLTAEAVRIALSPMIA